MASNCWLCSYSGCPEATRITRYFADNAGEMDCAHMAIVIRDTLAEIAPGQPGTSAPDILAHLTSHTLQPAVRLSVIQRNLVTLLDKLGQSLYSTDDDGNLLVDSKNVQVYLKVAAEIRDNYKIGDFSKLAYADVEKIQGGRAPRMTEL